MGGLPVFLHLWYYSKISLRDPGVGFGFDELGHNILLVTYVFCVIFPASLVVMWKSNIQAKPIVLSGIGAYTALHLLYGYNGLETSGLKALLTFPRFFICCAPIMVLFYADAFKSINTKLFSVLSLVFMSLTYGALYYVDSQYEKVRSMVYNNVADGTLNTTGGINEIAKIVYPERGILKLELTDIKSSDEVQIDQYLLEISRFDTESHSQKKYSFPDVNIIDSIQVFNHIKYKLYRF